MMDEMKRKFLSLLASLPLLNACSVNGADNSNTRLPDAYGNDQAMRDRFKRVGVGELILDAVNLKNGVTFYDEKGQVINATGTLAPRRVDKAAYPGGERGVPKTVRATWRTGKFEQKAGGGGWVGGSIIGDYTIPVAERIPDEVLDYIRKNGGALRIKLRLKDDGIMLGWDVQVHRSFKPNAKPEDVGYLEYVLPGGDFLDTKY
jgi:hypothetical protein